MPPDTPEDDELRSVTLQNAQSIQAARRRIEQELAGERERLRITLSSIGDGVISTDAEGRVTFLNGVAEKLTGWTQAEAAGRPLAEVFHIVNEYTRDAVDNPALRALREGRIVGLANHTVLISRDGSELPIDDSAAPMHGPSGEPVGAVLVFRDVSERKLAYETQELLAAIVASSDDAIISKNHDGIILSWNTGAERLFGYTREEAVGRPITMLIPPELMDEERFILDRFHRGERVEPFETVRVAKDGHRIDISLTISPVRDDAGKVIAASKVARDITEKKRTEKALRENRERLDYAVRVSGLGFWYCDLPFDVLNWDALVKEHFWLPADAHVTLETFYERIHLEDRQRTRQAIDACILGGAPYDIDYRTVNPATGEVKWVRALGGVTHGPDHTPVRFDGVTVDITARKLDELRLAQVLDREREQGQELREQDRRKNEFLALLAHELRNPLAPLRNGLQLMRLAAADAGAIAQARGMMERQLGHMVRLIDDLLDISRISQNKMELKRERILLDDVISNAVETARPLIETAKHELTVSLPHEPVALDADLTRLAQIFSNLLTNSAKYTEPGGRIRLTAESVGSEVIVTVADTGIGIPAEALPGLFDMFSQVDRSIERSAGGLGIGLALVKGIAEMHNGSVQAISAGPGKGSEFKVRLPIVTAGAGAQATAGLNDERRTAGAKRRVLIVDDNRDSAGSMAKVLSLLGNEVHTAHDGIDAVALAEQFRPEVILMDVGMPRLNGYDATRRIRQQPWGRDMVVIAVTGWGQEGDRLQSREAGCDGHLVKPVNIPDLENLLAELQA